MSEHAILQLVEAQSVMFGDMNRVALITKQIIEAIPSMDWDQLLQTWDYARDIQGQAWKIECACAAEATKRISQRGARGSDGRFIPDYDGVGVTAAVRQLAHDRGVTNQSIWRDAKLYKTFFAGDRANNVVSTVPDPLEKSHYLAAMRTPDPHGTLEQIRDRKAVLSSYSARDAHADVDAQLNEQHYEKLAAKVVPLTELGQFPIIYADPPWQYEGVTTSPSRRIERQYPTMATEALCELPVGGNAQDDAVLFLWATSPLLPHAFEVMRAWGFAYVAAMYWVKDRIGLGHWVRNRVEPLLIGRRGEWRPPLDANVPDNAVESPRLAHSVKPVEFYDIIDQMYPGLPKLELFARQRHGGVWTSWGNEVGREVEA